MTTERRITRRAFCRGAAAGLAAAAVPVGARGAERAFRLRYILASCLYGRMKLETILPEVRKVGAEHIDIWPRHHGDQREQIEAMGHEKFAALLRTHRVRVGVLSRYDLGPFGLRKEMQVARKFGARVIVCGASGPARRKGAALKAAVGAFVERMKPHAAAARAAGVTIAVENHGNSLIESSDSIRWLGELSRGRALGVALAPYHLPQDAAAIGRLIEELGGQLAHFYAWQHGKGCHKKLPKAQEMLQLPGRGPLDFAPIVAALRKIRYAGWVETFMHPVPRGTPILPTAGEVTAEIQRARRHLDSLLDSSQKEPKHA
jgi:sugar phosphate isomerase/epimerase